MELRFGITMRITNAQGYEEPRDSIAHDWSNYMENAFPNSKYLFIPNNGDKAVEFIKKWDINALIISGGDDIGTTPLRDKTEFSLLKYAIDSNIPTIAICRGLQLVHIFFGGELAPGNDVFVSKHRAKPHDVTINNSVKTVNSYHTNMLNENTLNKEFKVLARCNDDNSIEAIKVKNILAMMWHPERDEKVENWNKLLIENFIKSIYETSMHKPTQ